MYCGTYPSVSVLEYVGRFDVTMANAVAVDVVETPRGLRSIQVQEGTLRDRVCTAVYNLNFTSSFAVRGVHDFFFLMFDHTQRVCITTYDSFSCFFLFRQIIPQVQYKRCNSASCIHYTACVFTFAVT